MRIVSFLAVAKPVEKARVSNYARGKCIVFSEITELLFELFYFPGGYFFPVKYCQTGKMRVFLKNRFSIRPVDRHEHQTVFIRCLKRSSLCLKPLLADFLQLVQDTLQHIDTSVN